MGFVPNMTYSAVDSASAIGSRPIVPRHWGPMDVTMENSPVHLSPKYQAFLKLLMWMDPNIDSECSLFIVTPSSAKLTSPASCLTPALRRAN